MPSSSSFSSIMPLIRSQPLDHEKLAKRLENVVKDAKKLLDEACEKDGTLSDPSSPADRPKTEESSIETTTLDTLEVSIQTLLDNEQYDGNYLVTVTNTNNNKSTKEIIKRSILGVQLEQAKSINDVNEIIVNYITSPDGEEKKREILKAIQSEEISITANVKYGETKHELTMNKGETIKTLKDIIKNTFPFKDLSSKDKTLKLFGNAGTEEMMNETVLPSDNPNIDLTLVVVPTEVNVTYGEKNTKIDITEIDNIKKLKVQIIASDDLFTTGDKPTSDDEIELNYDGKEVLDDYNISNFIDGDDITVKLIQESSPESNNKIEVTYDKKTITIPKPDNIEELKAKIITSDDLFTTGDKPTSDDEIELTYDGNKVLDAAALSSLAEGNTVTVEVTPLEEKNITCKYTDDEIEIDIKGMNDIDVLKTEIKDNKSLFPGNADLKVNNIVLTVENAEVNDILNINADATIIVTLKDLNSDEKEITVELKESDPKLTKNYVMNTTSRIDIFKKILLEDMELQESSQTIKLTHPSQELSDETLISELDLSKSFTVTIINKSSSGGKSRTRRNKKQLKRNQKRKTSRSRIMRKTRRNRNRRR